MSPPRVARINVTPVKSLRLHHPDEIELGPDGAREDRRFLLVDDGRRLYNGKRDTSLVRASATWDPVARWLELTMPDGALVVKKDPVEYYKKLRFHRGVGDAAAYGL